jgi:hypothetical protein
MTDKPYGLIIEKSTTMTINGKGITKITNHTDLHAILSLKPIYPKRKIETLTLIRPDEFAIYEEDIDFTKIYISFEENNGD